eukprot:CAMPEP_0174381118 /NCGR_PEP_ID=MMETSP0811_2-20130205/123804_1 /TAXON_ID=73025 ORGANISM="Eutreptiella gymnastica-like, Strain CCMP1594" /NCGR_SAMPLE_ID=MMETSP0811_2 /ASSEMBLY_ACC=CAM_ASM_000667 /LENGTH=33 /DNA_ID= /DNA_START= /DNA_END= /DNA_ORIENTATION=
MTAFRRCAKVADVNNVNAIAGLHMVKHQDPGVG